MSQEKPKVYSAEFRESAVKLANESDKPIAQTAKAVRTDDHLYEELKRLKKETARLIEERDLLKKAAAYFAKEQR